MTRGLTALLLFFAASHVASATQVVFLIGQSNASGRASSSDLGYIANSSDASISYWYNTDKANNHVLFHSDGIVSLQPIPTFGPEMGLARTLYQAGMRDLFVVKVTEGGTNLYYDWDPTPENPGVPNADGQVEGFMYNRWVSEKNLALAALGGKPYTVAGIFMDQGTADGSVSSSYYNNLTSLANAMRSELGDASIPFVLSRIQPNGATNRERIRTAQVTFGSLTYNSWVNTDDLVTIDGTHYDAASQLVLGQRMALAIVPEPGSLWSLVGGVVTALCGRAWISRRSV